ncbi:MAG: membrane-bound O-acyltransferase family protein, partial [Flavobacteriaceae bacterium CG_4_10_14_3_um_filter_33_47]
MVFNSLEFFIFLPVVFFLYWFVFKKHLKAQNILLLLASYVFYGLWDWRFLSLILLSTIVDYYVALKIHSINQKPKRKAWLWVSVLFNVGLLGFFKYFNFFVDSWVDMV